MEQEIELEYHQATFALLGERPLVSSQTTETVAQFEQRRQITLPASVREWYSLKQGVTILDEYSNGDHAISLEDLETRERYWSGGHYHAPDLLKKGLLPILVENQGVCTWAIQLNGADDPPVVVSFDGTMPFAVWQPCADTFSTFVYTRVWDFHCLRRDYVLFGWEKALSSVDLHFLQTHFQEGPQTYSYPGLFNYRFSQGDEAFILFECEDHTDWWVSAESEESLWQVTKMVWECGTLKQSLKAWTPTGETVLAKLRSG